MRSPKPVVRVDPTAAVIRGTRGESESVSLANHSNSWENTNVAEPARPPTPHWSENQPWASNLESINVQCINDINAAVQSSRNALRRSSFSSVSTSISTASTPSSSGTFDDDDEGQEWEYDETEYNAIPLDLLEQAFEQVRQKTNTIIDEAKASAIAKINEIPPHLRADAVGWFTNRLNIVMQFLGYVGDALKRAMQYMMKGAKGAWMSVLRSLRVGVARRALAAAHGVRNLRSVTAGGARQDGIPLRSV